MPDSPPSTPPPRNWAGELWGGFAAMLVALPSAIAFGVAIFAPLGAATAAAGAVAGILGTMALGLIAPAMGGTNRLITAPCAPAAAVLAALAHDLSRQGITPEAALLMMTLVGLMCGAIQLGFGAIRLGRLIKYMPFPVVSGYLSGVGLIIVLSQVPKLLGAPGDSHVWHALFHPSHWSWPSIAVGIVTMTVMVVGPRITKAVPASILGLAAGVLTYFGLGLADHSLFTLDGNKLVIGPVSASASGFLEALTGRWKAVAAVEPHKLTALLAPALTLAVLLSIDTLKTCLVLDTLTKSRHNSNRELIGQGLGNLGSTLVGGLPGAGQMGATLVNITSGGQTRLSGTIEGVLALAAFLLLGRFIAWIPVAGLAGILIVVGLRMFDKKSFQLLRHKSTIFDFAVIVAVVVVAETVSLIWASGVGIALAIFLFIREQVRGTVIHRKSYGHEMFSKQVRLPEEMAILERKGAATVIFDLQGSLFFGTTDQLYTAIEPELKTHTYVLLDMRRVQTVDFTCTHMLEQIEATLAEHKGYLLFSHFPHKLPSGRDLVEYFERVGLARPEHRVRIFAARNEALEWIENRLLEEEHYERPPEKLLDLREMEIFRGRKEETLAALEALLEKRSCKAGGRIFARGDGGDELFLIRSGSVRIVLPVNEGLSYHVATFARGNLFGELTFLDGEPRSADAYASTDCELFVLSRKRFDTLALEHKRLTIQLIEAIGRTLAIRLRRANVELRALQDG